MLPLLGCSSSTTPLGGGSGFVYSSFCSKYRKSSWSLAKLIPAHKILALKLAVLELEKYMLVSMIIFCVHVKHVM